eukprot:SAG22_NODE_2214_length_2828_cov_2.586295_1_plen_72_part_10
MPSVYLSICLPARLSQLLLFAAFFDYAPIVKEMVFAGFDLTVLDHLIVLEMKQDHEIAKLKKNECGEPPAGW